MNIFVELIVSFLSSLGFAFVFSCPKRSYFFAGVSGAIGWMAYSLALRNSVGVYSSTALGAFVTGVLGEVFARKFRMPASVFIIPGIISLCPGSGIYYTLQYFVNGQNDMGILKLLETAAIAGAISFGILLASASSRSLLSYKTRKAERLKYTK